MNKIILVLSFLLLNYFTYSQELSQVSFASGANLSSIAFLSDREVLLRISDDGKILEWGIEAQSLRSNNYYAPRLQPYMGRIEYFGAEADSINRGKLRSIGTCSITYYGPFEIAEKIGKLKSVGIVSFDYYSNYDNTILKGKLRFVGGLLLDYYSPFEDPAFKGKLKSIGSTTITYYSSFDDKLVRGKIKSIGGISYKWFTSVDQIGYGGGLKSGSFRQNIGGVTYILQ